MSDTDVKTERQHKRARIFAILGAACVCALILIVGIAFHVSDVNTLYENELAQQTLPGIVQNSNANTNTEKKDKKTSEKRLSAPPLMKFIGLDLTSVMSLLGEGATATSIRSVNAVDSVVSQVVTIALTNQVADLASGTPTVTLSLDVDGTVVQAGYSANMQLLGYGSISFIDAVENMHVVENLLLETGLAVPAGSAKMPTSKSDYAVYGADGITLDKEQATFSGSVEQAGNEYGWSGQLTYDYTQANASGNLAYTVRLVSVTIIAQE